MDTQNKHAGVGKNFAAGALSGGLAGAFNAYKLQDDDDPTPLMSALRRGGVPGAVFGGVHGGTHGDIHDNSALRAAAMGVLPGALAGGFSEYAHRNPAKSDKGKPADDKHASATPYGVLMAKLASQDFKLNPNLQDVMQRVREVGLHKVAAQMHNVPEFNIRVAVENLGMQLCLGELRREKIASGLQAYNALVEVGEIRPLV